MIPSLLRATFPLFRVDRKHRLPNRVGGPGAGWARRASGVFGLALLLGTTGQTQTILGSAGSYAVMAGSTVTINGATLTGDLGAANIAGSLGYSLTGATVVPVTAQNLTDLTRAFNGLAAMTPTANLSGQILGTVVGTLTPGVYKFDTTAQITGTLTLDAQGKSNAVWVFQVGSTLTTAASSNIAFVNQAANSVANNGVFWQVGTTATLGNASVFEGNLLGSASSAFDLGSGATLNHGRVLTGASGTITLAGNPINFIGATSGYSGGLAFIGSGTALSAVPEPSTYALFAGVGALAVAAMRRRGARRKGTTELPRGVVAPARL